MKKWNVENSKFKIQNSKLDIDKLIKVLLENRGIKTKKEIEEFLNPQLQSVTIKSIGIDQNQLETALKRIQKAIENKEQITVFGDYDVDGICGTAILWETLNSLGANVMPYIPHRIDEGYGLSVKGIEILKQVQNDKDNVQHDKIKLIITVDNGIVANEAVEFANKQGIDIIITDHHVPSKKLPKAHSIVHTTNLCGTGVAYLLSQEVLRVIPNSTGNQVEHDNNTKSDHLALVALATVADLVPLTHANRTLTKFGLDELHKTTRVGLLELFKEAALDQKTIGTYEIGHIISPRLNAMGRLEYAMDSLRLLCTHKKKRAEELAQKLGSTNRERQLMTQESVSHALEILSHVGDDKKNKLIFISHETYPQGVIGLVAGKLVEKYYRPAIVVSIDEKQSKASARSIPGFNIIEFIRNASEFLIDAGGHPMAAGFTVETANLDILQKTFEEKAHLLLTDDMLIRTLRVDCELLLQSINDELFAKIQKLQPFGMGNPEPVFVSDSIEILDIKLVGKEGKHIKCKFKINQSTNSFEGIGFGLGEKAREIKVGDKVAIVYSIDENIWNGNKNLQLKIKDIRQSVL